MNRKAIIFGIKGTRLTYAEKKFLKSEKPWGIILFSRNIKDLSQITKLVKTIKKTFNDNNYPILIDQEGGRVSRLNKIINLSIFSQKRLGDFYHNDKKNFNFFYSQYINKISFILKSIGININTAPVLDVYRKSSNKVIGDRSFSSNPHTVSKLGKLCIQLYEKNKIATVIKHIPGHGLSKVDTHHKISKISKKKNELIHKDFVPFKNNKSLFAMTAHIIYQKFDSTNVCTHSKIMIKKIIRKHLNFNGIIISDDISMKSLKYDLKNNAKKALESGCNLVLHCNGNIKEMLKLAKIIPTIDKFTQKKTSQFYDFLG